MNEKKTQTKQGIAAQIRAKKTPLLRASLVLFAAAYPLTYLSAQSGNAAFMGIALCVTALGSLLAAVL
jgi:hypothetical protein